MPTDDEDARTDDSPEGATDTPRGPTDGQAAGEASGESDLDPQDAPEIRDHRGPWDEVVNRIILLLLPVGLVASVVYLILSGSLRLDYAITGEIPAETVFAELVVPAAYAVGLALLALYVLALMKFYGANPFVWVVSRIRNAARDYRPDE